MSTHTILIVDDDREMIRSLTAILADHGYRVQAATEWRGLLSLLGHGPLPDLILMDVRMPEFDGFELLAMLKCRTKYRAIPVIVITAQDASGRDRALESGAADYLTKPLDLPRLLARIAQVVDASSSRTQKRPALSADELRSKLEAAAAALDGVEGARLIVYTDDPALLDAGEKRRANVYAPTAAIDHATVIEAATVELGHISVTVQLRARPATAEEAAQLNGRLRVPLTGGSSASLKLDAAEGWGTE